MNTPPRNDAAPLAGGAGVKARTGHTQSSGDSRYMQAWCDHNAHRDEGGDWATKWQRLFARRAALAGPLDEVGPLTRLTLALMRGDRAAAVAVAQAISPK